MPAKKGKAKDVVEDNAPPGILKAHVEYCGSINKPARQRMGHLAYVHPRSGLLYVVGGYDVQALPQAIKASPLEETAESMPFAEWWDAGTCMWGGCSATSCQPIPQLCMTKMPPICVNEMQSDVDKGGEEEELKSFGTVSAAPHEPVAPQSCVQLPDGFSWPTLAATVVYWGPVGREDRVVSSTDGLSGGTLLPSEAAKAVGETVNDADGNNVKEESAASALREHPVILFVGGWKGSCRTFHTVGVDMDRGTLWHIRGGMFASSLPSTCLTGSAVHDCVYVFGGNTGGVTGAPPIMRTLDLSSRKWGERTGEHASHSPPLPRSSHVAGVLLDRYIVIHGGRRLASTPAGPPAKGRKSIQKMSCPIQKLGLEFCSDVAVYDLEKKRWVATAIHVGSLGPPPRYGHAACVLSSTELLFHGGIGVDGNVLSDAWILLLLEKNEANVSITWVKLTPSEANGMSFPGRYHHALAAAGRRVFITGGVCQEESVGDVCIMDIEPLGNVVPTRTEGRRRTVASTNVRQTSA
ncbi:hypothetical protein TraAM80_01276 [Trypanosoma rangeli]|uniref:Uncharacterized protein n=1 Tax=Trypanosoma rangeli TaxID=5698 RepID=A0A3R7M8B3_TRYRA|nr:uncharacterized protein TraAM80_01276 [Trypanosoma rangeli]RNF10892.1 hypothetical protein TraAM80_01276 [Trypanosoma rangeli]|eukprot:RNF10892.1 hypothetical protein TraAM80_01276 [Trypanosoma rangeli]